jgi:hypothetical protein
MLTILLSLFVIRIMGVVEVPDICYPPKGNYTTLNLEQNNCQPNLGDVPGNIHIIVTK